MDRKLALPTQGKKTSREDVHRMNARTRKTLGRSVARFLFDGMRLVDRLRQWHSSFDHASK